MSFSDQYRLSEHRDSSAIPPINDWEETNAQCILLDSIYRKRFLKKMALSEKDTVYVYDFARSVLNRFPIKNLRLVARINIYGANWPYDQTAYMIGFDIKWKYLKGSDHHLRYSLVSAGKNNPFIVGQVKIVQWKQIESSQIPHIPLRKEDSISFHTYPKIPGKAYLYTADSLNYYVQEYEQKGEIAARRLLVLKQGSTKKVCERVFYDHESASPAPLNGTTHPDPHQFAGRLFKNKAPVIFGFEYVSFGCPIITFVKPGSEDLYLNCDNRH